jgi:hypothetical protein
LQTKLQIEGFKEYFKDKNEISQSDIFNFYSNYEPISNELARKRTETLVRNGILKKIAKGIYSIGPQINYAPIFEPSLIRLCKKLKAKFPYAKFCLWDTRQLNEFMLHQPGRFYLMVETEPDVSESAFNFLNDFNKNVFQSEDQNMIYKYASLNFNSIIVNDLISEAPVQTIDKIPTATLEKILIDIFCDKDLYITFQGSELSMIFQTAFEKYTINKSKLLRYAKRRGKGEIIDYLYYLDIKF